MPFRPRLHRLLLPPLSSLIQPILKAPGSPPVGPTSSAPCGPAVPTRLLELPPPDAGYLGGPVPPPPGVMEHLLSNFEHHFFRELAPSFKIETANAEKSKFMVCECTHRLGGEKQFEDRRGERGNYHPCNGRTVPPARSMLPPCGYMWL